MPPTLLTPVLFAATVYVTWESSRGPAERRTTARKALLIAMGCATLGAWIGGYAVDYIDAATGWPGTARLMRGQLVVAALAALETMLVYWQLPPKYARPHAVWRTWIAAGVVVAMAGLFLLAGPGAAAETPPMVVYHVVYGAALAAAMTDLAIHASRYARWLDDYPYSRAGLHMFTVGGLSGCVFPAVSIVAALGGGVGAFTVPDAALLTAGRIANLSTAVIAAGAVVPTAGPAIAALYRRVRRARAAEQLRPLWQAIIDGFPGLQLETRRRPDPRDGLADMLTTITSRDDWRVYRRVIEVRDGYLELRPYMDEEVINLALRMGRDAGLHGTQLESAVEAAVIAAALRAKHLHSLPTTAGQIDSGGSDMSGEIRWLAQVARQLTHPVVVQLLAELDRRDRPRTWVDETLDLLGVKR